MPIRITDSEFHHVLALLRAMLVESGLGAWEIEPWLARSADRLAADHRTGTGAYFIKYLDGQPVGVVGAQLRQHHAFLSTKCSLQGIIVDEYILPNQRGCGVAQQLRAAALAWISGNSATPVNTVPPNAARYAALSGGGKL